MPKKQGSFFVTNFNPPKTNGSVKKEESTNHPKQSDFGADQLPNRHQRWHIVENSMQAKAQPEAQLGDSSSRAKSLGSVVAIPTKYLINPPS